MTVDDARVRGFLRSADTSRSRSTRPERRMESMRLAAALNGGIRGSHWLGIAAVCAGLLLVGFAPFRPSLARTDSSSPTLAAVEFIRSGQPCAFNATVLDERVSIDRDGAAQVVQSVGELRYVQDGAAFRIDSTLFGEVNLEFSVTFDGQRTHFVDWKTARARVEVGLPPDANLGSALPIPHLEALAFAEPTDDAAGSRYRSWSDAAALVIPEPLDGWTPMFADGRQCLEGRFPGAVADGVPYEYRVLVDVAEIGWPWRVERVLADGQLLTRSSFAEFAEHACSGGARIPSEFCFECFEPETGRLVQSLRFMVSEFHAGASAGSRVASTSFLSP